MRIVANRPASSQRAAEFTAVAAGGLLAVRWLAPERGRLTTGWPALLDSAFAVGLVALVALLAIALGRRAQRLARLDGVLGGAEGFAIEAALGLGLIAFCFLLLGLLGLFHSWVLIACAFLLGLLAWPEIGRAALDGMHLPRRVFAEAREGGFFGLSVTAIGVAVLLFSVLEALGPPAENDALMYHLQAPRMFMEAGRLFPTPEIWQANGPMLTEMLYALGLAFGTDSFARLLHLLFSTLLAVATFGVAKQDLGARGGWFAAAVLLGIPILPLWGSLALTDMAWALYCFLAVLATLRWSTDGDRRWLVIGGVLTGFAASSKYLGLGIALLLIGWIAGSRRHSDRRARLKAVVVFVACAAAVATPWFVKNLLWTGNPVYPFLFGGPDWTPLRLSYLMTYLRSFGAGTGVVETLLLPWNLYVRHAEFGTIMTSIDVPSPFFLLALAFPWARPPAGWGSLGVLTVLAMLVWAAGSQQTRFLLPLYPILTLLSVVTLCWIDARWQRPGLRVILPALALGAIATTLAYQVVNATTTRTLSVVLGWESKASYLRRILYDYSAMEFIEDELPENAQVALLWDGRGYYCDSRCLPDADLSRWPRLLQETGSAQAAVETLRARGVSHILVDLEELSNGLRRDRGVTHEDSVAQLAVALGPPFARVVFSADKVVLYELTSPDG